MFIEKNEIFNFTDDNTIYNCGESLWNILKNLTQDMKILLKCFRINSLQVSPDKFQFVFSREEKAKFAQTNDKFNWNWRK